MRLLNRDMSRAKVYEELFIRDDALVLEVGSGDNPMPRSDVLTDLKTGRTGDRQFRPVCYDERPFIVCDGQHLPFKSGAFDYVICRQVLEYTDNPVQVLLELQRIAPEGYIEVANGFREALNNWPNRKWAVKVADSVIIRALMGYSPLGGLFGKLDDDILEKYTDDHWTLFNYCCEWQEIIPFYVEPFIDALGLVRELRADFPERTPARVRDFLRAGAALLPFRTRLFRLAAELTAPAVKPRKIQKLEDIIGIMACPRCGEPMSWGVNLICGSGHEYSVSCLDGKFIPEVI